MGKLHGHSQRHHKIAKVKAQDASHTQHRHNPKTGSHAGVKVRDADIVPIFDINRRGVASIVLLASLAAMVIRPVRAQPAPPTVRVADPNENVITRPTFTVSGDRYCKVIETSLDPRVGSTIRARYMSNGPAWGSGGGSYVCGETEPIRHGGAIYGQPFIPNSGRFPGYFYAVAGAQPPSTQSWPDFQTECQAVIDYCGNN